MVNHFTWMIPTSKEREMATSILADSRGVHNPVLAPVEEGLDIEPLPGVGLGDNGMEPTSRSTT